MCYISGGIPEGGTNEQYGCTDKTPPKGDEPIILPFSMYFAKSSGNWDDQGIAFIKPIKEQHEITYGRMYLIKQEQFKEVVKQENRNIMFNIDLNKVIENGSVVFRDSWYGNIIHVDNFKQYPIFTFTSAKVFDNLNSPSKPYLRTIIDGLRSSHKLSNQSIIEYLTATPGNSLSNETIINLVCNNN